MASGGGGTAGLAGLLTNLPVAGSLYDRAYSWKGLPTATKNKRIKDQEQGTGVTASKSASLGSQMKTEITSDSLVSGEANQS